MGPVGRNIATALVGKLLPYYVVLMLMFVLMVGILDVWLGVSFRGNAVLTAVSATSADRRLSDDRLPDAVAGAQHGGRAQSDGDHRLARLRLRRRGFSGAGDAGLSARLGHDPAAAVVYPDPVRPGHARRRIVTSRRNRSRSYAASRLLLACLSGCASARWPGMASRSPKRPNR